MTSVYTELTKEAGRRGGPAALRRFYLGQGVAIGSVLTGAALTAIVLRDRKRARLVSAEAAPAADAESTTGAG